MLAEKRQLRACMREKRRSVVAEFRKEYSAALCRRLLSRSDVQSAIAERKTFSVYLASADEIDLTAFIEALHAAECRVAVPAWEEKSKVYDLLELAPGVDLIFGPHGISEPDRRAARAMAAHEVSVWIVPGLAFTADGGRLGYGGGWYDRFLSASSDDAISLGVGYPFQLIDSLPLERHDIRLSDIVTENTPISI
jgi:5-formyltetrahydrofolate cyclo-ligase